MVFKFSLGIILGDYMKVDKFRASLMSLSPRLRKKVDPRRIPELLDSRMIQEDENAIANCPTQPINREFHHSYVNPYDDNAAIRPVPYPRHHRYDGGEDLRSYRADVDIEDYG